MIRILESSTDKLKIKQYPANQWLAFIFLSLLSIIAAYHIFFQSPIDSSLICTKNFLNQTNCQLIESALLNHDLTDRQIKNVKEPHKTISGRSNVIWLATDINIWRGKIQNIYYHSSLFLDPFLYRTNKQVSTEINKLNSFINSPKDSQKLKIERKVPKLFLVIVWMMILPLSLPVVFIIIFPVVTYSFNAKANSLTVAETLLFSTEEKEYSLENFKIKSKIDDKEPSIVLTIGDGQFIFKEFTGEKNLPKILELIKPFTTMSAKAS